MSIDIGPVDLKKTVELRQRVLRPHESLEEIMTDALPSGAWSFGAIDSTTGAVLSTATVYRELVPEVLRAARAHCRDRSPWRLRGVATEESHRRLGLAGRVLSAIFEAITEDDDALLWCFARLSAREFYRDLSFLAEGEVFDVEAIGPHVAMYRLVDRPAHA